MKIVVAIDSFKESLSSLKTGTAIKNGIHLADLSAGIHICPLADCGEGKLDEQTAMGKATMGIASLAKKYGKPVIAFSGCASHILASATNTA